MNNGELYRHYRNQSFIAKGSKWASIIAPFGIVFGCKYNEYIKILGEGERYKLTIGCILAIIVAAIAVLREFKKSDETKPFAGVVGWGLAFALCYFFSVAMKDLTLIIGSEFAGQVAAIGFDYWGLYASGEAKEYKGIARKDGTLKESKFEKVQRKIDLGKQKEEQKENEILESRRRATE